MDAIRQFLDDVKRRNQAQGHLRGLLHLLIGRRIATSDGELVSDGLTWREAAALLKKIRWDKKAVRELGLEPADLPPRDRERYWYQAIVAADVSSSEATEDAEKLAERLRATGYEIGPPPGQ